MKRLTIDVAQRGVGTSLMKISGFNEAEWNSIFSVGTQSDQIDRALDILDVRNGNLGTCWHNGYGVYGISKSNEVGTLFLNVGTNCE